jgi:peroxiredoxin
MELFRKTTLLVILILGLGAWFPASWASVLTSDKPAPSFLVESGDNQKLSLDLIRGKVIVLFYESRHVIKRNTALKDELTQFYRAQPADIKKEVFRLVVIDCSKSFGPATLLWKSGLREHSGKEGFTIYGDWTGRMCKDYRMKAEESNFLIIDKNGIIRYSATGKIDQGQFGKIKELLLTLVQAG